MCKYAYLSLQSGPFENESLSTDVLTTSQAIEDVRRMFVDEIQVSRIVNDNQTPAKRAAFVKQHGVAYGRFEVEKNLPSEYQVGLFQPGAIYDAWVRYSSDIPVNVNDKNSTVGIGIKLFGISGAKEIQQFSESNNIDITLQNTQVFFASTAEEMAAFKAAAMSGKLAEFRAAHPELDRILTEMANRTVMSLLTESLWSCIPHRFGTADYCKFSLKYQSVGNITSTLFQEANGYLEQDLYERLVDQDAKLDFYVQKRNNPATQSIEDARSLWDEKEAVPFKVATLVLPKQNIRARGQSAYGESLAFNPSNILPELAPVGSIAETRAVVYRSSSKTRKNVNGQMLGEPTQPRPHNMEPLASFVPSLEFPWPVGTTGHSRLDFEAHKPNADINIVNQPFNRVFDVFYISRRDMPTIPLNFRNTVTGADGVTEGMVLFIDNTTKTKGALRIVFADRHVSKFRFGLNLVSSPNHTGGGLVIQGRNEISNVITPATPKHISLNGYSLVTLEKNGTENFKVITFDFDEAVESFELDNFVFTY